MPGLLVAAERHLRIGAPADLTDAVTRSHLDDGRCVGWYGPPTPGWRVAIDAERVAAPVPPALARRFGVEDFWARWTRAECCCKLADVPVAAWWRRHGLGTPADGSAIWRTLRLADLVVTVGFGPTSRTVDHGVVVPDNAGTAGVNPHHNSMIDVGGRGPVRSGPSSGECREGRRS